MSGPTWDDGSRPDWPRLSAAGYVRAVLRGVPIALTIFGLLPVVVGLRATGANKAAQRVVSLASRATLRILGLTLIRKGRPDAAARALVANHSGWPDIFTLSAALPVNFVSKAEVSRWPGIGLVARGTGTLFIERRRSHAARHRDGIAARLAAGERLLFFPEGTSTDNRRVLNFRPTLFAAFLSPDFAGHRVQPISVCYCAPEGLDPRIYAWWGDMDFAPHFLLILSLRRQGQVTVEFHPSVEPDSFSDRKAMAAAMTDTIRAGLADAVENCA